MTEKTEVDRRIECVKLAHLMVPGASPDRQLAVAREIHEWIMHPGQQPAPVAAPVASKPAPAAVTTLPLPLRHRGRRTA